MYKEMLNSLLKGSIFTYHISFFTCHVGKD